MAVPKAPLFGFGASGKLGDALVYSNWKGIDVAREYVIPANPKSSAQTTQRGYFTSGVSEWHEFKQESNALDQEAWNRYAGVLGGMSGFNAFVRNYVNQRKAGNTPIGFFKSFAVTDTLNNAFDCNISVDNGAAQNVTMRMGTSKTFFPKSQVVAMVAGAASIVNFNTGFGEGATVFLYFEVASNPGGIDRSGLYTAKLT